VSCRNQSSLPTHLQPVYDSTSSNAPQFVEDALQIEYKSRICWALNAKVSQFIVWHRNLAAQVQDSLQCVRFLGAQNVYTVYAYETHKNMVPPKSINGVDPRQSRLRLLDVENFTICASYTLN
jgi:hypothetical protein